MEINSEMVHRCGRFSHQAYFGVACPQWAGPPSRSLRHTGVRCPPAEVPAPRPQIRLTSPSASVGSMGSPPALGVGRRQLWNSLVLVPVLMVDFQPSLHFLLGQFVCAGFLPLLGPMWPPTLLLESYTFSLSSLESTPLGDTEWPGLLSPGVLPLHSLGPAHGPSCGIGWNHLPQHSCVCSEKHRLVAFRTHPDLGPNSRPRCVPQPGIRPLTFLFVGRCPAH